MATEWDDKSIEQPDIVAAQDPKFTKDFAKYSVANPHPGFGKDPNILNEFGHTMYPKWVFSKIKNEKVIVNNEAEETEHTEEIIELKTPKAGNGWSN